MMVLMAVLNLLLFAALLLLAVPVLVVFVEVLSASFLPTRVPPAAGGPRPRLAVLVPAHDEALVIRETLAHLSAQMLPGDRIVVVADNCSDDTAAIARACGAEVLERFNATQRGKGYALDHGVRHLARAAAGLPGPPELVLVVDADCTVAPGAIETLARRSQQTGRPVQARYAMLIGAGNTTVSPIAAFAWRVKTWVSPLGMHHLGGPCLLMGSGMAIPWRLLKDLPLASSSLVEDMQMGVDLARRGAPPLLCPQALVTSTFPVSRSGADSQRTRWVHGHLAMLVGTAPRLLALGLRERRPSLVAMALEIMVPPKALLVLLILGAAVVSAVATALGASAWTLALAVALAAMFGLSVVLAWWQFGRDILPLAEVPRIVTYIVAKVPLYLRFLVRRQVEWVRSKRDAD